MRKLTTLVSLVLVTTSIGCGPDSGGRVPAVGYVTLDGAPLTNVYVTFRPDDGEPGNGGFAITDAEGRFEIAYPDTGKGLVPARYRVTVAEPPRGAPHGAQRPAPMKLDTVVAGPARFPPIYSSPENTPLRAVVSAEGSPLKIELFSKP